MVFFQDEFVDAGVLSGGGEIWGRVSAADTKTEAHHCGSEPGGQEKARTTVFIVLMKVENLLVGNILRMLTADFVLNLAVFKHERIGIDLKIWQITVGIN